MRARRETSSQKLLTSKREAYSLVPLELWVHHENANMLRMMERSLSAPLPRELQTDLIEYFTTKVGEFFTADILDLVDVDVT